MARGQLHIRNPANSTLLLQSLQPLGFGFWVQDWDEYANQEGGDRREPPSKHHMMHCACQVKTLSAFDQPSHSHSEPDRQCLKTCCTRLAKHLSYTRLSTAIYILSLGCACISMYTLTYIMLSEVARLPGSIRMCDQYPNPRKRELKSHQRGGADERHAWLFLGQAPQTLTL